jgi:hypothetical protein
MPLRVRVSTKASLFEERKQQNIQHGYTIENEQPIPMNGLCSFTAVKDDPPPETYEYQGSKEPQV